MNHLEFVQRIQIKVVDWSFQILLRDIRILDTKLVQDRALELLCTNLDRSWRSERRVLQIGRSAF